VIYAHVFSDPDDPATLVLQYWFFYLYNDWNDRHEGDWEMIQLFFDAPDARSPRSAGGLAQHYELEGNRGFIRGRWKIVSLQPATARIDLDNWMLFDLEADPTEIDDLAKVRP